MNRRKLNISQWYSLGLAVLLAAACLVGATGVSLARYRAERDESISFAARVPDQICLGTVEYADDETTGVFVPSAEGGWENVEGQNQLKFAVANGTSTEDYASRDVKISLRLVGSLGVWNGENTVTIKLAIPKEPDTQQEEDTSPSEADTTPSEADATQYDEVTAVATRIGAESPMYSTFGDGWEFSFLDEEGKEMIWTLKGGALSFIDMKMTLEGMDLSNASLLQLQVTQEFT